MASYHAILFALLNDDVTLRWLNAEIIQFFSHALGPDAHVHTLNLHILPPPVLRTRSRRSGVLGVGLRACRGERVLGVEAGELGSGGRSGGG